MTVSTNGSIPKIIKRIEDKSNKYRPNDPRFIRLLYRIAMILQQEGQVAYRQSGLRRRTGTLANSLQARVKRTSKGGVVQFAPWGVRYAAIHEFGGTIRMNRGGKSWNVTIPKREYLKPTFRNARKRIDLLLKDYSDGN